ncbi:MAG TPA: energy transducer TonB [Bryobacteraceae bacterium]|nr:energy transducer TonB [Bryobacteraceae bacterium]
MADLERPKDPNSSSEDDNLSHLGVLNELEDPWYKTLISSIKELVHPAKLPPLDVTSKPVDVVDLGIETKWYVSFWQNLKDLVNPPKLPPLEVTSKPVPVKDIWGLYGRQKKSFMVSTGVNVALVAVACLLGMTKQGQKAVKTVATLIMPVDTTPQPAKPLPPKEAGGGGDRSPLPASFGKLPKASLRQFTPAVAVYNNMAPKLAMDPSIIAPPDANLPQVNSDHYGDPFSKSGILSNGQGSGGGIGNGKGGGIGNGSGAGFGDGFGTGALRVGGGVTAPQLQHKVEPEYSEEARKAKFQGTVVLYIEVDPSGKATNIHVLRSLGLGLDEKAIEAVKKWTFIPGKKNGVPVTVQATVEVNFRLL